MTQKSTVSDSAKNADSSVVVIYHTNMLQSVYL
jgi:hypothetical protein